jgi:hypothetical protein
LHKIASPDRCWPDLRCGITIVYPGINANALISSIFDSICYSIDMENFEPKEFRDNLSHLLKSIPDHRERGDVLKSAKETDAYEAAQKKEKAPILKVVSVFDIPSQVGELDFKQLLAKPLFNGEYYLSNDSAKELVDNSQPFSGVKGGEYRELETTREDRHENIFAEIGAEPFTLNEWRYLFSQLKEEQLLGCTTFYVRFDDGEVRAVMAVFDRGEGPGGYSLSIEDLDAETEPVGEGDRVIAFK